MSNAPPSDVVAIEILEDLTDRLGNREGFLHVRRYRAHNVRADQSHSVPYRIDVIERPTLDAVAVLLYRRTERGLEALTRANLRPAAYFRRGQQGALGADTGRLQVQEIVAGVLEPEDRGEAGIRARAVAEAREEAGILLTLDQVKMLGGPFFVAPGILSEQIFLCAADCTDARTETPEGDGTPLEEGGALTWWPAAALLEACRRGEVPDAKTEIALTRFFASVG